MNQSDPKAKTSSSIKSSPPLESLEEKYHNLKTLHDTIRHSHSTISNDGNIGITDSNVSVSDGADRDRSRRSEELVQAGIPEYYIGDMGISGSIVSSIPDDQQKYNGNTESLAMSKLKNVGIDREDDILNTLPPRKKENKNKIHDYSSLLSVDASDNDDTTTEALLDDAIDEEEEGSPIVEEGENTDLLHERSVDNMSSSLTPSSNIDIHQNLARLKSLLLKNRLFENL